jgi:ubiquitin C-terminal hydrolase
MKFIALRDPSSSSKIDKSAKVIYDQLSKHRRMFGDRNEQDAEECLQALLSMMSIELKEAKRAKDRKSLIIENSSMPPHLPFEGWCSSTITCLKCNKSRPKKHQTFVDISLSLQNVSSVNAHPDLMECLDQYSFQESLSDVECLNCSFTELLAGKETLEEMYRQAESREVGDIIRTINYLDENSHQLDKVAESFPGGDRVRTNASKQLKISRLPEVLCLHLSRRYFCPRSGNELNLRARH